MKFSDIDQEKWAELKPYLDTCLLPLTGLTGQEEPWEVTNALIKLRDVMDCIEQPFKGRVVTYPAIQYLHNQPDFTTNIDQICENLKIAGFSFVILVTAIPEVQELEFKAVDLVVSSVEDDPSQQSISNLVQSMWN